MRRTFSRAFKIGAVRLMTYEEDQDLIRGINSPTNGTVAGARVSRELDVAERVPGRWMRDLTAPLVRAISRKDMRFAFIARHRHIWPVSCPPIPREIHDAKRVAAIRTRFGTSERTCGARRVWRDVFGEGCACGRHRIARLMRSNALRARPGCHDTLKTPETLAALAYAQSLLANVEHLKGDSAISLASMRESAAFARHLVRPIDTLDNRKALLAQLDMLAFIEADAGNTDSQIALPIGYAEIAGGIAG